jgi:N-acetyl-alpha-D-muramate 1-phosphate uridylyltransferase
MKAMIMAAGKGTRLGKITESVPKVLVEINGKTVIERAVEKCRNNGFDDIIINVHHFPEMVMAEAEKLNRLGYRITISDESDALLDTGGGLYKARHFFDESPFLVYNADILTDLDLGSLYNYHLRKRGLATLAVRNRSGNRYFLTDNEGKLAGWRNKATGEEILTGSPSNKLHEIAFSGIHIIEPAIFRYMTEGTYSMTSLYLKVASIQNIFTYRRDEGYWFDIGTPENLAKARETIF